MFQTVNFCIPPLRTKIQLAQNWSFRLFHEDRNTSGFVSLGLIPKGKKWWDADFDFDMDSDKFTPVTLVAGSVLNVARIYIRQGPGFSDYDSVTFTCKKKEAKTDKDQIFSGRFWVKLADVNKIVCFPIGDVKLQGFFNLTGEVKDKPDRFDFI